MYRFNLDLDLKVGTRSRLVGGILAFACLTILLVMGRVRALSVGEQ